MRFPAPACHGVELVLPENASIERRQILKAYGVDLVLTDPAEGTDGAIRRVREIYRSEPGRYFYLDQYNNPANGLELLGFYHSHPDHPSKPSEFDREHAIPWYSYLILSIEGGISRDVRSWRLADDRTHFENERILVIPVDAAIR